VLRRFGGARRNFALNALGFLLRAYSYLFHLILSLCLIAVALLSTSGEQLRLSGLLPFNANNVVRGLLVLGAAGLVSAFLAISGIFRYLFPIWATLVLVLTVRGIFFSSHAFPDRRAFEDALWFALAVLAAFFGGIWVLKPRRGRL
jgi:hypothetical protein